MLFVFDKLTVQSSFFLSYSLSSSQQCTFLHDPQRKDYIFSEAAQYHAQWHENLKDIN